MLNQNFNGLLVVNLELTSRCNKSCWMCGRRKLEKDYSALCSWGDMTLGTLQNCINQIPQGIVIQYHNNGEPLLYPYLKDALISFPKNIRCFNTNGKLLLEKSRDIIDHMESLTVSVIENDPEQDEQYETVKKFLDIKKDRKPFMVYRLLGKVKDTKRWKDLQGLVCSRVLHNPMGSFKYKKKVTIPEIGICLDLLSHIVIDRFGDVYPCVRFNPHKINKLGNINKDKLIDMWNSPIRLQIIEEHKKNNRSSNQLCNNCDYYGVPRGE
jgi:radical SAM protein with 4Fe4S-binding SPASM domain